MGSYSIVGLGKLGASMAAAIASRGHRVIGVDVVPAAVEAVNAGRAPVQETDLDATIAANRERISATHSYVEAVRDTEITFVVIPTPSDDRGAFDISYARTAFAEIGSALKEKDGYHLVVLTSTVLPGSTRYGLIPLLEERSGKRAGEDFGVCYSPEFIALGSVIRDFLNPDFTLIGEFDQRSGDLLEAAYSAILAKEAPAARMSIENAEVAKVAVNTFVTTKIAFANMLADLCRRLPGGDVDAVTRALGMDSRIGAKYLTGALGYGGPCFPRDNVALSFIARELGVSAAIPEATDATNRSLPGLLSSELTDGLRPGAVVAVLGLAYKPASHVVEESQSVALARAFVDAGATVRAFDPLVTPGALGELASRVQFAESVRGCVEGADLVLVTTPDPAFKALRAEDFGGCAPGARIVDFWRSLPPDVSEARAVQYVPYGRVGFEVPTEVLLRQLWSPEGA
ncbi:MAG: UDP-glucose/GDP-mannose dehydrogenase family protein [Dehalococcoidia bacterium]